MDEQAFWDKQHEKYTSTDWINKPSIFAQWVTEYLPPSGSILELGAGQAQDSRFFADRGYKVTATDLSPHGLELAKQKSPNTITFGVVDLWQPLPFADESFDIVYAHLSLHYLDEENTHRVFADILRVLKPGGMLAALFNTDADSEIAEGTEIEPNYIELDGIRKRYFSPESAREFAKDFEIVLADREGTTYKDRAKGNNNLIRLVAMKRG